MKYVRGVGTFVVGFVLMYAVMIGGTACLIGCCEAVKWFFSINVNGGP